MAERVLRDYTRGYKIITKKGQVHFLRGRKNDRREEMKLDQIGFWSEIKLDEIAIVEGRK